MCGSVRYKFSYYYFIIFPICECGVAMFSVSWHVRLSAIRCLHVRTGIAYNTRIAYTYATHACNASGFGSLDQKVYFLVAGTSSELSGEVCILRSSGQGHGQGHRSSKCVCVSFSPVVCFRLRRNLVSSSVSLIEVRACARNKQVCL